MQINLFYYLSRFFERAGYYGLRSILVMYFMDQHLGQLESNQLYALILEGTVFAQLLGAVAGDLLLGNHKSMVAGILLQACGAFVLAFISGPGIYLGLIMVMLGAGLYTPNILSSLGKINLHQPRRLDSIFTLFIVIINLGAFLGSLIIPIFAPEKFALGFVLSGVLYLLAAVPLFLNVGKQPELSVTETPKNENSVLYLIFGMIALGAFWALYELGAMSSYYFEQQFVSLSSKTGSFNYWFYILPVGSVVFGILMSYFWFFKYVNALLNIALGFILGALGYGVLLILPASVGMGHAGWYIFSIVILCFAEIFVTPIVYSLIARNANPKYLAIFFAAAFVPSLLLNIPLDLFRGLQSGEPTEMGHVVAIVMAIIGIAILLFYLRSKRVTLSKDENLR